MAGEDFQSRSETGEDGVRADDPLLIATFGWLSFLAWLMWEAISPMFA
jgi:hypothetical protein